MRYSGVVLHLAQSSLAAPFFFTASVAGAAGGRANVSGKCLQGNESYQFFALVSKNAGYNVQLFDTRAAAENWLAQALTAREHAGHPAHA